MLSKFDSHRRDGRTCDFAEKLFTDFSYISDSNTKEVYIKSFGWVNKNSYENIPQQAFYIVSKKQNNYKLIDFITI